MGSSSRVCVLGSAAEPGAERWARALGAPVVADARSLVWQRPEVVIVRLPVRELGRAALLATVAGAAAVLAAPVGEATPLPWWGRRFHRFVLGSQEEARAWGEAGVALGRMVVVAPRGDEEEGAALRAVLDEVRAMALRPDIRRRAR